MKGGAPHTLVLQINMKNIEGGRDTEQFRNVQESERYVIHVSGTKLFYTPTYRPFFTYTYTLHT